MMITDDYYVIKKDSFKRLILVAMVLVASLLVLIHAIDMSARHHYQGNSVSVSEEDDAYAASWLGMEHNQADQVDISNNHANNNSPNSPDTTKQTKTIPMKQTETVMVNGQEVMVETQTATWADEADEPGDDEEEEEADAQGPRWQNACPSSNFRQEGIDSHFHHTTVSILGKDFNETAAELDPNPHLDKEEGIWTNYYPVQYQCVGDEYNDKFRSDMKRYAKKQIVKKHRTKCWGKRWNPIPANKRVLVIGNSHTMQVARSMMGYAGLEAIADFKLTHVPGNGKLAIIKFNNGGELVMLGNYPGVAAVDLSNELARILDMPLDSFDAVIMGLFNTCNGNSNFAKGAMELMQAAPDKYRTEDCLTQRIPTFDEMAAVYTTGPILFISMFATYANVEGRQMRNQVEAHQKTYPAGHTVDYIAGRGHILGMGDECGAKSRTGYSLCDNNRATAHGDHRCMGEHGGHPDLVAWDATEFLYSTLAPIVVVPLPP